MIEVALLFALVSTAQAQVTPIGPFVGTMSEDLESLAYQGFTAECLNPDIFGGTTSMCTPGTFGVNITSGWSFVCFIGARSGSKMYGSGSGYTQFTFTDPVSQFGGYFSSNSGVNTFTVEFYDVNGGLIDSVFETLPAGCLWTWYGYEIPAGAAVINVIGSGFGGAYVMMDDLEATDNPDIDGDGVLLADDNCPDVPNPTQDDIDLDGLGDACDNCVFQPNPGQADGDGDGIGDVCECLVSDSDGDGIGDGCDNCELISNADQADLDGDHVGDVCDRCLYDQDPLQLDADGDTHGDACDVCPDDPDPNQEDADADGVGDACDICPTPADPIDSDNDGACDGVDICPGADDNADRDSDGFPNSCDICPSDADPDQLDSDGDGFGDACDDCPFPEDPTDSDNDTVCDGIDACPYFDDRQDQDGDLVPDDCDVCPEDAYDDSDGDGTCDSDDLCPLHDDSGPDADADGYVDGCDNCGDIPNDQRDYDGDGFGDLCDCFIGKADRHPGADEVCNDEDDDCDGDIDEDPIDGEIWYQDADGDGQGDPNGEWRVCGERDGLVENTDDCDDFHALAFVGGTEICDNLDNDCNGKVDDLAAPCNPGDGAVSSCGCDGAGGLSPVLAGALIPLLALRRRRR